MVPRPLQHVHRQQRRVGHLQEEDALARNRGDARGIVLQRERVEAVEDETQVRMVGALRRSSRPDRRGGRGGPRRAPRSRCAGCAARRARRARAAAPPRAAGSSRASGEVFEQTSISGAPSACIRSNLRSARSRLLRKASSGMPSKSRNGWNRSMPRPRSSAIARSSPALPLKVMKSFSNSSMPSKRAAAIASSFWRRVPLIDTVAIDRRIACLQ